MIANGLYKIKDKYYSDFPHERHIHIKDGRPFYYAVKGSSNIYWFIPLSTQVDNFRRKIVEVESKRGLGNCLAYHIGVIANQEMVLRICDMIPVTDEYVDGEFYKYGSHYVVKDRTLISAVSRKSRDFIKQLELGRMYSQVGALEICERLSMGGCGNRQ